MRLAQSIKRPEDTGPAQVEKVFKLQFKPSNHSKIVGLQGALGSGTYEARVKKVYPHSVGHHVSVRVTPVDGPDCPLRYERLRDAIGAATGFALSIGPRYMDPYHAFVGTSSPNMKLAITLEVDRHDDPECVDYVTFDMEKADA